MRTTHNPAAYVSAFFTISLFLVGATDATGGEAELDKRVKQITQLISASPNVPEEIFAADFLSAVPVEKLALTCKQIFESTGDVTDAKVTSFGKWKRKLLLTTEKGMEMPISIQLESAPPHRVTGLWFGTARPIVKSYAEIGNKLEALEGTNAVTLWQINEDGSHVDLLERNANQVMAIGSTFKLYILGALLKEISAGALTWKHIGRVRPHRKSWPSGILQNWPDNSPLTLQSLASLMISRSDNTATDILLFILGRKKVEAQMEIMGNENRERTVPFLGTREMFILRTASNAKLKKRYLSLDKAARRKFLREEIGPMKRTDVDISLEDNNFQTLEWFASTSDLCRGMIWLKSQTESSETRAGRELMTISQGLSFTEEKWKTVAFKGGSEPGVINLTWLLERADGKWFALSATSNNTDGPVDKRFNQVVQGLISFLETQQKL